MLGTLKINLLHPLPLLRGPLSPPSFAGGGTGGRVRVIMINIGYQQVNIQPQRLHASILKDDDIVQGILKVPLFVDVVWLFLFISIYWWGS
jgi:hypothetical protein